MKNKIIDTLNELVSNYKVDRINIQYTEETLFGKEDKTIGYINRNIKDTFEHINKKLITLEIFNYELELIRLNTALKEITIYYKEKDTNN